MVAPEPPARSTDQPVVAPQARPTDQPVVAPQPPARPADQPVVAPQPPAPPTDHPVIGLAAPARSTDQPVVGYKRARLLVHPTSPSEVRFAGPVEAGHTYRPDDVFVCPRGHRRLEPGCTCGFYAVQDPATLRPSVVRTVLLEVELEGRVVRHPHCLRGERQRVGAVVVDGWCAFCVRPATAIAAVRACFTNVPEPWHEGAPVCERDAALFPVVLSVGDVAAATGTAVRWDRGGESVAARSLRRLNRARRGAI
jgi:hypothetical protein